MSRRVTVTAGSRAGRGPDSDRRHGLTGCRPLGLAADSAAAAAAALARWRPRGRSPGRHERHRYYLNFRFPNEVSTQSLPSPSSWESYLPLVRPLPGPTVTGPSTRPDTSHDDDHDPGPAGHGPRTRIIITTNLNAESFRLGRGSESSPGTGRLSGAQNRTDILPVTPESSGFSTVQKLSAAVISLSMPVTETHCPCQ